MMERTEKRRKRESEKLTASNVSELHEKRLNEQLVMQNYLAEKMQGCWSGKQSAETFTTVWDIP